MTEADPVIAAMDEGVQRAVNDHLGGAPVVNWIAAVEVLHPDGELRLHFYRANGVPWTQLGMAHLLVKHCNPEGVTS